MQKFAVALLAAAATVSAGQLHRHHGHAHLHKNKRVPTSTTDVVTVPGPTQIVYVLNGQTIPAAEVMEGIANGTLILAPNGELAAASSSSVSLSTSSSTSSAAPSTSSVSSTSSTSSASSSSSSSSASAPSPSVVANFQTQSSGGSGGSDADFNSDSSTGIDSAFPDGQLDCSDFPSAYGAIPVPWTNLGGWTGVQNPGSGGILGGFANILTMTSSQCQNGVCCTEGSYCSYACPAGYQKSQWPTTQGSTGQSVGGLLCQNGKLHLTNPSLSSNLCVPGSQEVTVLVQNTLSQNVAVCRTDYPGTESETVPLNAVAGATSNLTCPDAATYYTWKGASTSAQYYVNPAGVGVSQACTWGSAANPWGNYAPLNIGVGYSNGAAWLSIFQNLPTTSAKLGFTVTIQGDGMSGTCRYSNGQYCGGANYDQCSTTTGCTVSLSSGTATFVFSD